MLSDKVYVGCFILSPLYTHLGLMLGFGDRKDSLLLCGKSRFDKVYFQPEHLFLSTDSAH
jgi:hypothetical protein